MILPLQTKQASLENVGGKGANLAKLARAGFPVPDGFLITTEAYRTFVEVNQLMDHIHQAIAELEDSDPDTLQHASESIRQRFSQGTVPYELKDSILRSYGSLNGKSVAVRSSATAEDLPDMSFAGQQDTFLNVIGEQALLDAVVRCWSSLWTARAIGYRARNAIPHEEVALSVVVQEMVQAEVSGVLFTANPLSGKRTETVIDATLGLGEALVGGHVEPDHYVVETAASQIIKKTLGAKAVRMRGDAQGGVVQEEIEAAEEQALPDEAIIQLVALGQRVEEMYDFPQDVEWAWADGKLYLLQSRPITSLFPIPEGMGPEPLQVLFSFGSVQGLLDPMTPLGQDTIRLIFAGGASLLDFQVTHETQGVIKIAGERLWGNLTPVLRHPIGKRAAPRFFSAIDPGVVQPLEDLTEDPHLGAGTGQLRLRTFRRIAGFLLPLLRRVLQIWRNPGGAAVEIRRKSDQAIAVLKEKSGYPSGENLTLERSVALYREIYHAFPYAVPNFIPAILGGLIPLGMLSRLSKQLTGSGDLALEITRGLPHNVTTEMDLSLWETARAIRQDGKALQHMEQRDSEDLAAQFLEERLPGRAQEPIGAFIQRYGMRGVGEIDIGRKRWNEDPTHIMQVLKGYLKIEDERHAPDVVFQRGEAAAQDAITKLEEAARSTFGGALKAKFIRWAARRIRALAGLREGPKFHIIQMMDIIRKRLLERGEALASEGALKNKDDLFFLYISELEAFASGGERDWRGLIAERRANYRREMRRNQIPRLLLSDGRAFYEGLTPHQGEQDTLRGSPVSPGVVEGKVRVVLDPHRAELSTGEILVCPATDPAWTPLFLAAAGLVMEVGGMMTHGAIVAREYGIPAVVGVHQATSQLQTGQRIRVNGSTGQIMILEKKEA